MRLKKVSAGKYVDRDTGKPVPNSVAMPIIYGFTLAGYKGYMNSPNFKVTETNKLPVSLNTIAERLGGRKEDYAKAQHMIATWYTNRKIAKQTGAEFTDPFPSP